MKFSWQWLNKFIDLQKIPLNEIICKLTLAGFEVEDIENLSEIDDKTLNISITANRSDTASIIGLARELSTILNAQLLNQKYNQKTHDLQEIVKLNPSQLACESTLNFQLTIIKNITLKESPKWLQNYLRGCNIKPTNTFSDIIQYINMKWGQDIEIFDIDKIDKDEIQTDFLKVQNIANRAKYNNIIAINNQNNSIEIEALTYKNTVISLLGISSNSNFFCDIETSSIMILGQIYKLNYIQKTINILKYKTEKSQKHLKGISRNDLDQAYVETINLILNSANKNINFILNHTYNKFPIELNHIRINQKTINNILGPLHINRQYLSTKDIIDTLETLKFTPKYQDNTFFVTIPEYRHTDIKRQIDVIEEIARIHGFNNFIDKIPEKKRIGKISKTTIFIEKIRHILRNLGLHEVLHYSLENTSLQESNISLYNPLQEDQIHLRNHLIYNLLNTIKYNNNQKNPTFECFEIGRVFRKILLQENITEYKETIHLAGIIGKNEFSKTTWSEKGNELSWFQAKGLVEHLFEKLHTNIEWKEIKNSELDKNNNSLFEICHPYRIGILQNHRTKEIIGLFSELNTKYSKELSKNHHIYIFELNLLNLIKATKPNTHLYHIEQKYSHYPTVTRDLSLKVSINTKVNLIQKIILSNNHKLFEHVKILNDYLIDNGINKYRNINMRMTYRSSIRTLNDYDIKSIDNHINTLLKKINQVINIIIVE